LQAEGKEKWRVNGRGRSGCYLVHWECSCGSHGSTNFINLPYFLRLPQILSPLELLELAEFLRSERERMVCEGGGAISIEGVVCRICVDDVVDNVSGAGGRRKFDTSSLTLGNNL
jgi:hypothetical protein